MASRIYLSLFLSFGLLYVASAQDVHYSQFYNLPLQVNPALNGVFDGDWRFAANLRSQWYDVPVTYRTGFASFDKKLSTSNQTASFFSLGGVMGFDHAGDANMGTFRLAPNLSYTRRLTKNNFLTIGLEGAVNNRSFDTEDLVFDEQYNQYIKQFVESRQHTEAFENTSKTYFDFGLGVNWHYRPAGPKNRLRISAGAGLYHINEPETSFFDEMDIVLPRKWSIAVLTVIPVAKQLDIVANGTAQYQGPYTKHVLFGGGRVHLDDRPLREKAVQLGLGYRFNGEGFGTGDALYPAIQFHTSPWIFGLSYDINISDIKVATNNLGGPELSVVYIFKKFVEPGFCPTCPTYL